MKIKQATTRKNYFIYSFRCSLSGVLLAAAITLLLMANGIKSFAQAPIINGSGVGANFGVDADLYANRLQFGYFAPWTTDTVPSGKDDYFKAPAWAGAGIAVLDTVDSLGVRASVFKAAIKAANGTGQNKTYTVRMNAAYPPFSIVHGPNPTAGPSDALPPQILLDAVGSRDNNGLGGSIDSSTFIGTKDKNNENPKTWNLGGGSPPQKNDIINVGAHLRRDLSVNELWGFGFSSTYSSDGNSHTDFEIYRNNLIYTITGKSGKITNFGNDSGHTAGRFIDTIASNNVTSPSQTIAQAGDVLLTVDFENGGTRPVAHVFIWVDPNHLLANKNTNFTLADYNALPVSKRLFTFTGVTNDYTNVTGPSPTATPFLWAEITAKSNLARPAIFARVNTTPITDGSGNAATLGAPWGNLSAQSNPPTDDNMPQLQLTEVGVNFTALGLDIPPVTSQCAILFGSLMIKTRSSASFTAELKDFAGPFPFGNKVPVNGNAGSDATITCHTASTAQLCASSTVPSVTYSWTAINGGHIVSGANQACVTVDEGGDYVVSICNPAIPSCCITDTAHVSKNVDTTPPTITCPGPINIQCFEDLPACYADLAAFKAAGGSASDASGIVASSYTCTLGTLSGGICNGTIVRTHSITDSCGNTNSCTQNINIKDDTKPVITGVAGPSTVSCSTPLVFCNPHATDNCTLNPTITYSDNTTSSGSCAQTYDVTRTFTATDACGNASTATQTIHVVDNVKPVISGVGLDVTIECSQDKECVFSAPTASDNCDANPSLTHSDVTTTLSCGQNKDITRTWTATDACGNTSTASQTVHLRDRTAPVISGVGGAQTISCTASLTFSSPTVADNCDVNPSLTSSDATSLDACGLGSCTTRTWTATDACGNTSTASQTICKVDNVPPVINCPGNISGCSSNPTFSVTATDNCGGSPTIVTIPASGSLFPIGTTKVTSTATDAYGNSTTCTFTVTRQSCRIAPSSDNDKPTLNKEGMSMMAYPNPFSSQTTIEFKMANSSSKAIVEIFSLNGTKVATLFNEKVEKDVSYKVNFDGSAYTEGVYLYRITTDKESHFDRLVLMKSSK